MKRETVLGSAVPATVRKLGFPATIRLLYRDGRWIEWKVRDEVELSMVAATFRRNPTLQYVVESNNTS